MNSSTQENSSATTPEQTRRRHPVRKALSILLITLGSLTALCVLLLALATWWLSDQNLTRLLNKYGSRYLLADVHAENVDFTIWSTFPHFRLTIDTLTVVSRTLRNQPESIRRQLPHNCDSLLSIDKFSGGVNVLDLLRGSVHLGDMTAAGLRFNAVAYNDSINNYAIIPATPGPSRPPYITAKSLRLVNPREISFYSAATRTRANATIDKAELLRTSDNHNLYALSINGHFSARVRKLQVFSDFPFSLRGGMLVSFHPLSVRFPHYKIKLANVKTEVNMNIDFSNEAQISAFDTRVSPFDLMRLIQYLPPSLLPRLRRVNSDMTACASVRLTKPWKLSAASLPSFDLDFSVPSSYLTYTLDNHKPMQLHDIGMQARLVFNGDDVGRSYLDVPFFTAAGEGLSLRLGGRITNLLGNPHVSAHLTGNADCRRASSLIPVLSPYTITGSAHADTHMSFDISDDSDSRLRNVALDGTVTLRNSLLRSDSAALRISSPLTTLRFSSAITSVSVRDVMSAGMNVSLTSDSLRFTSPQGNFMLLGAACSSSVPKFSLAYADTAALAGKLPPLRANLNAARLIYSSPAGKAEIRNIRLTASARRVSDGAGANIIYRKVPDSITSGPHTPAWLQIEAPAALRNLLADWQINASLKAESGSYLNPGYPAPTQFGILDASIATDSLKLRSLAIRSQSTSMCMSGSVSNLRDFLLHGGTSPLRLRFDLALDTININQLAHTYEQGQAKQIMAASKGRISRVEADSLVRIVRNPATVSGSDTTTLLIPRNIDALLRVTAKGTKYTNLDLYDLGTSIRVANGRARVDSLYVSSSFGKAFMSLDIDTRRVQDYRVGASMDIVEIDVVKFFKKFNVLLEMAPYMSNLSGFVSAKGSIKLQSAPDMTINLPSVLADIELKGYGLKVHQSKFIRHITRMMLIGTSSDIHIPTIRARATVHDNLLELYPTEIIFNRYTAIMEGMNDFQGNLYYHIAIAKSPIPFRYAINIVGTYSHPRLRFGGFRYKPDQAMRLNSIMKDKRINIVKEAKYYLRKFVRNASEAETATPSAK